MPSRAKKPSSRARAARKPARAKRKARAAAEAAVKEAALETDRRARLGTKYTCFACGAKFYDLNKPEPLCPKCGADQRERPKESEAPPPQPPTVRKPPPRPMASLLDDEEEEAAGSGYDDDELEIGITGLDDDDDLFAGDEIEVAEDEDYED